MEIKIEYPLNKKIIKELFKESEKRGFVKGNIFKDVHNGSQWEIDEIMFYHESQDLRNIKGGCVWCNGKWAEIISYKNEPTEKIGHLETTKKDSIVESIVKQFKERSKRGIEKYGTTLQENNTDDFLQHFKEELMDAILYIEKLQTQRNEK